MKGDLKARVLAAARAAPSPARRHPARVWLVAPPSIAVAAGLFFGFDGPHHGFENGARSVWFCAAAVTAWGLVAAAAMGIALAPGPSALGLPVPWLKGVAAGVPVALLGLMSALAIARPELATLHTERVGFKCFALTLAAAALPLVALTALRRASNPVHPRARGAALGAACGACAAVVVVLWCPLVEMRHAVVGHVLPVVVLVALGAFGAAPFLAIRGAGRGRRLPWLPCLATLALSLLGLPACVGARPPNPASSAGASECTSAWTTPPVVNATLAVPSGAVLLHASASGTQNYACQATAADGGSAYAWTLTGPSASLRDCRGVEIGHHFASDPSAAAPSPPKWETLDGTFVIGKKHLPAYAPDGGAGSVPWLLLTAAGSGGSGPLARTAYIQRLETKGGVAPGNETDPCNASRVGATVQVPYTAEYFFYGP